MTHERAAGGVRPPPARCAPSSATGRSSCSSSAAGAPFFRGKNLVVAADCAPVAYGDFHRRFLKDNAVAIQCPKFGDQEFVVHKLAGIIAEGGITGLTVVRMEVPCCGGLSWAVQKAIQAVRPEGPAAARGRRRRARRDRLGARQTTGLPV